MKNVSTIKEVGENSTVMFGATNNSLNTSSIGTNNSMLSGEIERTLNKPTSNNGAVSSLNGSNTSSKLLKDLLESANNLPKPSNSDLGSIHLTLNELQWKSDLLRKRRDNDTNNFTKAHYLLASSGISAEDIENEINSIKLPSKALETQQTHNAISGNIDSYLDAKKDENILAAIEQSLLAASNDFNKFINENVSIDWKERRDELRTSIGLLSYKIEKPSTKPLKWNRNKPGDYKVLTPLTNQGSSLKNLTRDKFESYAQIIYQLNESRLENKFFPLAFSFEELTKSFSDLKARQVSEAWRIIIELTDEKSTKMKLEQSFFDLYQPDKTENLLVFKKQLLMKSRSYLEQQFYNYMDEIYTKDDKKEKYATPTNINKVSYFLEKIIKKNNANLFENTLNVNEVPLWALIFYLLRAGLYQDALLLTNQNKDLLNKLDKNFPVYLQKFIDNDCIGLPTDLSERMALEFNQQFSFINDDLKGSFDPYKYALFKVIGKCDLSRKKLPDEINLSIEDWLWFHLSIINEFNSNLYTTSTLVFENYTLENLQKKIIQLGPKKFNASSNNPFYLRALLLVGLYELSVQYTFEQINEYDAVHLAIGLCYYGLLRTRGSDVRDELIITSSHGSYEINFSRLLGAYTRFFKISDPKVASQYLILIAMSNGGKDEEQISKCHEALRELILVSREFNMLLGDLNQTNGNKIPGILEKQRALISLPNLNDFYQKIIESAAITCEEEGRTFDALLLYQLCQEYDTVVSLLNKLLGEILSSTELDKPLIDAGNYENIQGEKSPMNTIENNVILLAQHIMKMFSNNSFILDTINVSKKQTSDTLLSIVEIRNLFLNKNWNDVLKEIEKLDLIPVNTSCDLLEIRRLAEIVHNNLDDSLIRVIPSLLIMVLTSVSQLNYSILTKQYQILSNEKDEISRLKSIAKNCMIYAGIVQYKMPRETYSLLINLEALL